MFCWRPNTLSATLFLTEKHEYVFLGREYLQVIVDMVTHTMRENSASFWLELVTCLSAHRSNMFGTRNARFLIGVAFVYSLKPRSHA